MPAMPSFQKICLTAVMALALQGCDAVGNIGRSAEDRINEARPVRPDTLQMRTSLERALAGEQADNVEVQRELATRDRVRALTCSKGYSPSLFQSKEAVARNLTDQKCFDDYDRETVAWLKSKRLYRLLMAGALREVPEQPVNIFATTGGVNQIKFAAAAPIVVVTSNETVEVLDVGLGESLFLDRNLTQHPSSISISPNGRVFSVGGTEGIELRDTESGEVLFELPEHQRFTWLDAQTGLAIKQNQEFAELIDFARDGAPVPIRGVDSMPTRVVPLPGDTNEFLLSSYKSLLRYSLERGDQGVQAMLREQKAGLPSWSTDNSGEVTSDGAWLIQASNDLWITNLQSLESEQLPLAPFYVRAVGATLNPDEVLLFPSRGESRPLVFSISNRTFAPVEDQGLTAQPGYSALRAVFIPSLNRIAIVTGSKVAVVDDVKRGPRYGLEALKQLLAEEQRAEQEKNARAAAAREGYRLDRVVDGMPVASGPLLDVAKDAQIEAVGVYEAKFGSHGVGKRSLPGVVTVTLQRSPKPIVLVLSSYEPVSWLISGSGSADLKAVLLAGNSESTVKITGSSGVQVTRIGGQYAYQQGGSGFSELQREVIKRTGKSIDTFQGAYSGAVFMVGGRR